MSGRRCRPSGGSSCRMARSAASTPATPDPALAAPRTDPAGHAGAAVRFGPGVRRETMLHGRRAQCALLDDLLVDVRSGQSRTLVVRGQPGMGKTALLDYAADAASEFRMSRAAGVESEMELPFAALHQLCGRMVDRLERLPDPQADALSVAFGLRAGESPDRFLVGLAALSLMSDVAEEQPLLCVVDDAQWLDQASSQTLAFVARRLGVESIALLFGLREGEERSQLTGLPELQVPGLSDADSRELFARVLPGPLDESVRDRVVVEAH